MKLPRFPKTKGGWLTLGVAAWTLLFISCVSIDRTLVAPPTIAGANFIGDSECAMCHSEITDGFAGATHAHLGLKDENGTVIGCESCHGAGSLHSEVGGSKDTIVNPGRNPETCFQCHLDKRGEFSLPNAHPVTTGQMTCSDCHELHSGASTPFGGTQLASTAEACVKCHTMQMGPYAYEHEATREGCTVCHSPHGSVNAKMLKSRNQNLCLQCHFQQQAVDGSIYIGGRNHNSFLSGGTCWVAGCHEAVHGSHVNNSLRF